MKTINEINGDRGSYKDINDILISIYEMITLNGVLKMIHLLNYKHSFLGDCSVFTFSETASVVMIAVSTCGPKACIT